MNANGKEPVREWLKGLSDTDRCAIGIALKEVEYGWPVGMPTCRKVRDELWEVKTLLPGSKIARLLLLPSSRVARVLFYATDRHLVLVHGFIKKARTTPMKDIDLALERMG